MSLMSFNAYEEKGANMMTDYLKIARRALAVHRDRNQRSTVACPPAPQKPPQPSEEIPKIEPQGADCASEPGGQETTLDGSPDLLPIIPTPEPTAPPQPE